MISILPDTPYMRTRREKEVERQLVHVDIVKGEIEKQVLHQGKVWGRLKGMGGTKRHPPSYR